MRMSSRVARAVRELRGALNLAAENPKELSGILRCYCETLPTVSKKTAAILSATERWEDRPELVPALLGDLQRAGVVLQDDGA